MKATRTAKTTNTKITVSLDRNVSDKVAYMDGHNISTGREVYENYEIVLTVKKSAATVRASGKPGSYGFLKVTGKGGPKFAQMGNAYMPKELHDIIAGLMAEVSDEIGISDEQIEIEKAEAEQKRIGEKNLDRMAEVSRVNSGWCPKCQSYCYGDCQS